MKIFIQICFFAVVFWFFSCGNEYRNKILNPNFEKQLVAALDLKFINSDTLYQDVRTRVFNDTIVGYKSFGFQRNEKGDVVDRNDENFYFIQSLKDLPKIKSNLIKIPISNKGNNMNSSMAIDTLKNGCLYFGQFGGSTMIKLCADSTFKVYFKKYKNDMFYAMQIFLYKEKTIIRSMNAIYIYDTEKQKLLLKHKYYNDMSESVEGKVIGNDFVFKEIEEFRKGQPTTHKPREVIRAIDLNTLTYKWEIFYNSGPRFGNGSIIYNKNEVVFGGYIINLKNGKLNHVFNDTTTIQSIEKDGGYIGGMNAYTHENSTICKYDNKYKKIWQVNHVRYLGMHKNKILGINKKLNKKYLFILNRTTGKIENKILFPDELSEGFRLLNGYFLINNVNLYK